MHSGTSVGSDSTKPLGRRFWTLCSASALSAVGSGVTITALPLLVLAIAGEDTSARSLALVAAVNRFPRLVLSLPSGVLADRFDRRRIMLIADLTRAVALAGFCLLLLADMTPIGLVAVLAFVLGAGEAMFVGSAQPLVPNLVDDDQLEDANGRLSTAVDLGAEFVGPPLGSLTFSIARIVPFFVDMWTFVISAGLIWKLPIERRTSHGAATRRLGPAITAVRANMTLRSLWISLVILATCNAAVATLSVLLLRDELGVSEAWIGAALTPTAVGAVIAGIAAGRFTRRVGPRRGLAMAVVANAGSYVLYGSAPNVVVALVALFAWGLSVTTGVIIAISIRQRLVADELRGRAMSLFSFGIAGGGFIGALIASGADATGVRAMVIGAGIAQLVVVALVLAGIENPTDALRRDPLTDPSDQSSTEEESQ